MGILVQLHAGSRGRRAAPDFAEMEWLENSRRRSVPAANAPLDCLAGGALASRFHAWRGLSGRRYVCSVFPARRNLSWGGMPEFDDAVVLAVAADAWGARRRIAVFEFHSRRGRFCGDPDRVGAALEAGASEWHVHLLAERPWTRRAVIADLTP